MSEKNISPLEFVKQSMRMTNSHLDTEINIHIESCKIELNRIGVRWIDNDPFLLIVCSTYVKSIMNYLNNGEVWRNYFYKLASDSSLDEKYRN